MAQGRHTAEQQRWPTDYLAGCRPADDQVQVQVEQAGIQKHEATLMIRQMTGEKGLLTRLTG